MTTYLIGAGASLEVLPLVSNLPKALADFAAEISIERISNSANFFLTDEGYKNRAECIEIIYQDYSELVQTLKQMASFDTLAKKLTIQKSQIQLEKIKALLTAFFLYKQATSPLCPRQDSFFASILGITSDLPEDMQVLTWNYDSQFERAYATYLSASNDSLNESRKMLKVKTPMTASEDWSGFNLIKMNGSADFGYIDEGQFTVQDLDDQSSALDQCMKKYLGAIHSRFRTSLNFAWDSLNYESFIDQVISKTCNSQRLIVIGYSFPYFNREIDSKLFNNMRQLDEVIIQNPSAIAIRDFLISSNSVFSSVSIKPITQTEQFYLPIGI